MKLGKNELFIDDEGVIHAEPDVLEQLKGRSFLMLPRGDSFILKSIPEELDPPHTFRIADPEERARADAAFFQRLAEAQARGLYLDLQ